MEHQQSGNRRVGCQWQQGTAKQTHSICEVPWSCGRVPQELGLIYLHTLGLTMRDVPLREYRKWHRRGLYLVCFLISQTGNEWLCWRGPLKTTCVCTCFDAVFVVSEAALRHLQNATPAVWRNLWDSPQCDLWVNMMTAVKRPHMKEPNHRKGCVCAEGR